MKQEKKETKQKKPWSKKKKIIFRIIMGVVILGVMGITVLGVLAGPVLFRGAYSMIGENFGSTKRIDVSMTEEERLEDLEYLYKIAVLDNSNKEEFEKLYGINFEEVYATYQDYVRDCQSDFEFFCICFSFLVDMPSGHTKMMMPSYSMLVDCGFEQDMEYALQKDESKYLYSWGRVFEEEIGEYDLDNIDFINFVYVDGSYLAGKLCDEEVQGAKIITIDGMNPDDYILAGMHYSGLEYDSYHKKVCRDILYYNDTNGRPITIVCENADGEEVIIHTYEDYTTEMALLMNYNMKRLDPYYGKASTDDDTASTTEATTEEVTEATDPNVHKGEGYEIVEDTEHGVVYWYIEECEFTPDIDTMNETIKDALTRCDKVILDMRDNGGGSLAFYSKQIYPVLFKDDTVVEASETQMPLNEITESWANKYWNKLYEQAKIDKQAGIVTYCDGSEETINGNGVQDYQVYLLINRETFSSADYISHQLSIHDNVTVIGVNTGGEGIDGSIFVGRLPNSHLTFTFTPGTNVGESISNSVYGTAPDVQSTQTVEAYRGMLQDSYAGLDTNTYESRKHWDNVLWETWKICEE